MIVPYPMPVPSFIRKVSENSDDNSSVEAANEGLQVGEGAVRKVSSLRFESGKTEETEITVIILRKNHRDDCISTTKRRK